VQVQQPAGILTRHGFVRGVAPGGGHGGIVAGEFRGHQRAEQFARPGDHPRIRGQLFAQDRRIKQLRPPWVSAQAHLDQVVHGQPDR
jgi:hypothetical protein